MRYVFVSSTFKDMQFERDEVKNHLTPRIDTFLSSFGENVYFGDLRWGVNTLMMSEEESSKKVLKVCLDEIDDCRPYMIVFIGERYGWIPAKELMEEMMSIKGINGLDPDISVTNLEIEYGALINPDLEGRILFYFRNLDTSEMSEEEKKIYGSESPLHKEKLESLKRKIKELYPKYVREYDAKYNKETHKIENLSPLMDMVYKDLTRIFKNDLDKFTKLKNYQRAINSSATRFERYYKGAYLRKDLDYSLGTFKKVKDPYRATYKEIPTLLTIGGESGAGKNTYLACLYEKSLSDKNAISIPFVTGLDEYSKGPDELIDLITSVVEEQLKVKRSKTDYQNDPRYYMGRVLNTYLEEERPIIRFFIMNANMEIFKVLRYINFILELRMRNISFYVALEERNSNSFKNNYDSIPFYPHRKIVNVNEIDEDEKYDVIKTILKNKHKELPLSIIDKILEKPQSDSPLYLSLIIERLLILDHEDFEKIRHLGDGMIAIEKYMSDIVDRAGVDIPSIAKELLKEACERINPDMIPIVLRLLSYDFLLTTPQIEQFFKYKKLDYNEVDFSLFIHYIPTLFKESSISASYIEFRTFAIKEMAKEVADEFGVKDYKKDIIKFLKTLDEDEVIKDKLILEACYRFNERKEFSNHFLIVLEKFNRKMDETEEASEYEIEINKYLPKLYQEASMNSSPFFIGVAKDLIDVLKENKVGFIPSIISNIFNVIYFNLETTELLYFWAYAFIDITTYAYEAYKDDRDNDALFFLLATINKYPLQYFDVSNMEDFFDEEYEQLPSLHEYKEEFDEYDADRESDIFYEYIQNGLRYDTLRSFVIMASFEFFIEHAKGEDADEFFEEMEEYIINHFESHVDEEELVSSFIYGDDKYLDSSVERGMLFVSLSQRFFLAASKAWDEEQEAEVITYYEYFKKLLWDSLASGYFVPNKTKDPVLAEYVLTHIVAGTIYSARAYLDGALSDEVEEEFRKLYFETIQYADIEIRRYLTDNPNDTSMIYKAIGFVASIMMYEGNEDYLDEAKDLFAFITPFVYASCGRDDDNSILVFYVATMRWFIGSFFKDIEEANTMFINLIARKYYLSYFDKEDDEDSYYEIGRIMYKYMDFTDQLHNEDLIDRIYNEFFETAYGLEKSTIRLILDFCEQQENEEEDDGETEEDGD